MKLKTRVLGTVLALSAAFVLAPVGAEDTPTEMEPSLDRRQEVLYGEPVDRVYAPKIDSWAGVDGQRLILYTTPFKPYLVTLNRKTNSLNWEYQIGINNRSSYIDARFDQIYIDGFPYRIKRIEKLTRETAKALLRSKRDKGRDKPEEPAPEEPELEEPEQEGK